MGRLGRWRPYNNEDDPGITNDYIAESDDASFSSSALPPRLSYGGFIFSFVLSVGWLPFSLRVLQPLQDRERLVVQKAARPAHLIMYGDVVVVVGLATAVVVVVVGGFFVVYIGVCGCHRCRCLCFSITEMRRRCVFVEMVWAIKGDIRFGEDCHSKWQWGRHSD